MIHRRTTKRGTRYDVRLRDPNGRLYTRTFATRKEAERYERAELASRDRGGWIDPRQASRTLADVATQWEASNPGKRPSTVTRDEIALRLHVLPSLGARPVGSITPPDVQRAVNRWTDSMAPRTVKRTYGVLRAVLAFAVVNDLILRTPCRGIKLPQARPTERKLPTPDELARLADMLGVYAPMVWLGAVLGLRWGEVAGLRVGRLDLLRGTLTVSEQVTRGRNGVSALGEPKSAASRRTMSLPASLVTILGAHLTTRGLTGADTDAFLFVAPEGGMLDYNRWRRRVWEPACAGAGLGTLLRPTADRKRHYEGLGFHDLRRVNATVLVSEGVDIKTAQARLGHSDPRLTLAVYAQATSEADRDAADRVGGRLLPGNKAVALAAIPG
jgi:integrase